MHRVLLAIQLDFDQPGTSLVSLNFKKAFDRVDRGYLFQTLRKMNFPDEIFNLVECMYRHTKACLVIDGYLTGTIKLQRGVKQGNPSSALLFLIALEPLLERIQRHKSLLYVKNKSIAFADDVTNLLEDRAVETCFEIVQHFCEGTQFLLNKENSKIISSTYTVGAVKNLGVFQGKGNRPSETNQEKMLNILKKCKKLFNPMMRFRAKTETIETFVIPAILHIARHYKLNSEVEKNFGIFCHNVIWEAVVECHRL